MIDSPSEHGADPPLADRMPGSEALACQRATTRSSSATSSAILIWRPGWARRWLDTSRRTPSGPITVRARQRM
jgi:hypothetical protein